MIQMPVGSQNPLPSRTVRSRLFSHVTGASIRRSSARPLAAPRTRSIVPSVTMNGTTRSWVTSRPLTTPHTAPAAMALAAASAGPWRCSVTAVATVLNATTDPTDRSMPPATITIVIPSAATHTMTVWRATSSRLAARKNCGPTSAPKSARTSARPTRTPASSSSRRLTTTRERPTLPSAASARSIHQHRAQARGGHAPSPRCDRTRPAAPGR